MSRMRPEEVVRYARLFKELMSGRVEVQSSARRSYRAVVMLMEALLAVGKLKLASRMSALQWYESCME
jgi:biotin synthase-like enzyme